MTIDIEQFEEPADGGDWNLTLARALAWATAQTPVVAIRLNTMYPYLTTVVLPVGSRIVGSGDGTGFYANAGAGVPVTWCSTASGASDIRLTAFTVSSGATSATTTTGIRGLRFIGVTGLTLVGMVVENTADWGTSCESCTTVRIFDHQHRGGGLGHPGGRDGVHFLDCTDAMIDGADVWSGDDCVGVTCQSHGTMGVTVRNIYGRSDIAGIVTVDVEQAGAAAGITTSDVTISGIRASPLGTPLYVVDVQANWGPSPVVKNVKISDVRGVASAYGLWINGTSQTAGSTATMQSIRCSDIDVTGGANGHGVLINNADDVEFDGAGHQLTSGTFVGIQISQCTRVRLRPSSRGAAGWACQIFESSNVTIDDPQLLDFALLGFRLYNSTNVTVTGGKVISAIAGASAYNVDATCTNVTFDSKTLFSAPVSPSGNPAFTPAVSQISFNPASGSTIAPGATVIITLAGTIALTLPPPVTGTPAIRIALAGTLPSSLSVTTPSGIIQIPGAGASTVTMTTALNPILTLVPCAGSWMAVGR